MAMTTAHLKRRKNYLTASDVPAVMGLSPWKSPLQVYLDKTTDDVEDSGNEATQIGDDFEDALIFRAARTHKLDRVVRNQFRVAEGGVLAATLDAVAIAPMWAGVEVDIEAKTSGIVNPGIDLDEWGEDGTNEVPERVALQVQMQMHCAQIEVAVVSALLGRLGHRTYILRRNPELIGMAVDYCHDWWDNHVKAGSMPKVEVPSDNAALKYVRRVAGKSVEIDPDVVELWRDAKAKAKAAEEEADLAEARLKLALGDAEIGTCPVGRVSYPLESAGMRVDAKALKDKHPAVYAEVATASTRRVLRWKAAK